MKAADWIDRLKEARGWESDYRVAKELGIHRATVSGYRTKTPTLDDDTALKVAQALEVEPEIIILDQHVERMQSEPAKAALTRALKKLGGAVAGVVIAAGLVAPAPSPAKVLPAGGSGGLCIMSNGKRRRRRGVLNAMADVLQAFAGPSRAAA